MIYRRILVLLVLVGALMTVPALAQAYSGSAGATDTAVAEVLGSKGSSRGQPRDIGSPPTWIRADTIGLNQRIISASVDSNGVPVVPRHDIGWYTQSARPGKGDNVVLWGHVLRFRSAPDIPAPFGRLKEIAIGAPVVLYTEDGQAHTYIVQQKLWVRPHEVAYILPQGAEQLTMVSCIGEYVIVDGSVEDMSHRLITIAVPAP